MAVQLYCAPCDRSVWSVRFHSEDQCTCDQCGGPLVAADAPRTEAPAEPKPRYDRGPTKAKSHRNQDT